MITEYYRPLKLEEALVLLNRMDVLTKPLAGGSQLVGEKDGPDAVVDIQNLGLKYIKQVEHTLEIGAVVTIQQLVENKNLPVEFRRACQKEAGINIRNQATLGGTSQPDNLGSPVLIGLLAMGAQLWVEPDKRYYSLEEWLGVAQDLRGRLITHFRITENTEVGYADVTKTLSDRPLVMAAIAITEEKKTRVAFGGRGLLPWLFVETDSPEKAVKVIANSHSHLFLKTGISEYQKFTMLILINRIFSNLLGGKK